MSMIREVDALQESKCMMDVYEKKYGITSKCYMNREYDENINISFEDGVAWDVFIECYLECGGRMETEDCRRADDYWTETDLANLIFTKSDSLLNKSDKNKSGRDNSSAFVFALQWFAQNFVYPKCFTEHIMF